MLITQSSHLHFFLKSFFTVSTFFADKFATDIIRPSCWKGGIWWLVRVTIGWVVGWVFYLIWGQGQASLDLGGSWQRMPWGSVSSRDDPGVGLCIHGLGTRHCTCDLGIGLHKEVRSMDLRVKLAGVSHQVRKSLAPLTQIDLLTHIYR